MIKRADGTPRGFTNQQRHQALSEGQLEVKAVKQQDQWRTVVKTSA
jgi:hypothetical protein